MDTTQQDIQTPEPPAPAEYRPLIDGEIIAEGDEFQYDTSDWRPTGCVGMTYKVGPRNSVHHAPHRRPTLPGNIAPPPDGFEIYGKGPLRHPLEYPSRDVASWDEFLNEWIEAMPLRGTGPTTIYALRIGSPVHQQNK